jgi:gluconolactonase
VWRFDSPGRPTHVLDAGADIMCTNVAFGGPDNKSLFVVVSRRSGQIDGGVILRAEMPVAGKKMFSHA